MNAPLLAIDDLRVRFPTRDGDVHAVNGVSFAVNAGEVVAVVGESGSGKSVTAMAALGLVRNAIVEGAARWKGRDLVTAPPEVLRQVRGGEIGCIFQDPVAALNPVQKIGRQIGEMLEIHRGATPAQARKRAIELLELVGIAEPARRAGNYPHELSGGMCQRAMIAMAVACEPALLVADEPTTALDVTVQAQVLDELLAMRGRFGLAMLLITHDVGIVAGVADRVVVMYAGRIVESGTVDEVLSDPHHPYTRALMEAVPRLDTPVGGAMRTIPGSPPSPLETVAGCPFHPRCDIARLPDPCASVRPELLPAGDRAHCSACHFSPQPSVVAP